MAADPARTSPPQGGACRIRPGLRFATSIATATALLGCAALIGCRNDEARELVFRPTSDTASVMSRWIAAWRALSDRYAPAVSGDLDRARVLFALALARTAETPEHSFFLAAHGWDPSSGVPMPSQLKRALYRLSAARAVATVNDQYGNDRTNGLCILSTRPLPTAREPIDSATFYFTGRDNVHARCSLPPPMRHEDFPRSFRARLYAFDGAGGLQGPLWTAQHERPPFQEHVELEIPSSALALAARDYSALIFALGLDSTRARQVYQRPPLPDPWRLYDEWPAMDEPWEPSSDPRTALFLWERAQAVEGDT